MSSTERAPEPTMEEILASIRRIISEDEANAGTEEAAPEGYREPAASEDLEADLADPQIIADIERVLSGQNAQPGSADEEILDLGDLGTPLEASAEPELIVTEIVEEVAYEAPAAPSFADAFPSAAPEAPEPVAPAEPIIAMEAAPIETPSYAEPVPQPEPAMTAPPQPAEDPTAALERAIAALKAGDLAAFARAAETKYTAPVYSPPPAAPSMPPAAASSVAAAAPSHNPLPSAGPSLAEQFSAPAEAAPAEYSSPVEEPDFLEEPVAILEEELVILSEPEPVVEADEAALVSALDEAAEPATEAVSTPWHADDATWAPKTTAPDFVAPAAPRTNGGHGHASHDFAVGGPKSLEDSVKEMLRPMLRKWLDENMQRVLTQALREELDDPERPRQDG